ncbi:hypothetical protein BDZ89DRAFT_1143535 [Hymenopellis radicata]|nr:hypothetical protein BDZ89DRAFT_1143535 [Hymenopellis radicata]
MPTTVTLPNGIQWVTLPLLAAQFLINSQHALVMKYRSKAKIGYPQMYAEKAEVEASADAYKFNCMQRAHQNTLESINLVTTCTIITALSYPILASFVCGSWVSGRMLYTRAYLTGADLGDLSVVFLKLLWSLPRLRAW